MTPVGSHACLVRGLGCLAVAWLLTLGGCGRDAYPQSTPEAVIASARTMIENGDAEELHRLIHAPTPEMRGLLARTSRLLGHGEDLARQIQKSFPKEVEELRARTEQAAREGKPTSLLAQFTREARAGQRRRGRAREESRRAFDDALTMLFADPYVFLRKSEGRLTTTYLTDDSVALLWDGKPILPPLGMAVKQDSDGKWYIMLPTSAPVVGNYMPRSPEEYKVFASLIAVLDKTVVDLTREVQSGQLQSLEAVSRRAGEMTFLPAVLTFYAYQKQVEQRESAARAGKT